MKDWLTPHDVGELIGFSAQFIRTEIKAGELNAEQIFSRGGKMGYWRIHRAEAAAYIERIKRRTRLTQETQHSNHTIS